jgi:hypothetical protein
MPIPLGSRFGRSPVRTCVPANGRPAGHRFRKTSLLRIVPTACGQAADIWHRANLRSHAHARQRAKLHRRADLHRPTASILTRQFAWATRSRGHAIFVAHHVITFDARRCASVATLRHDRLSERSFSSRCQISRTRTPGRLPGDGSGMFVLRTSFQSRCHRRNATTIEPRRSRLVEPDGIEPTTSCLQSRRSPN